MRFFDWPYFLVMFASCIFLASAGAASQPLNRFQFVRRWVLELMDVFLGLNVLVSLISTVAIIVYGFFVLPWYTVLICAAVAWLSSTALLGMIVDWLVPRLVAILLSYLLLGLVSVWYFFGRSR
jgi:hypothetical protein